MLLVKFPTWTSLWLAPRFYQGHYCDRKQDQIRLPQGSCAAGTRAPIAIIGRLTNHCDSEFTLRHGSTGWLSAKLCYVKPLELWKLSGPRAMGFWLQRVATQVSENVPASEKNVPGCHCTGLGAPGNRRAVSPFPFHRAIEPKHLYWRFGNWASVEVDL